MANNDFEVLPVGTIRELIFARKFAANMISLNKTMSLPSEAAELIKSVEQSYKDLLGDELYI